MAVLLVPLSDNFDTKTFGSLNDRNHVLLHLIYLVFGIENGELERLDRQYGTKTTAAYLLEGKGWISLADADVARATEAFDHASDRWKDLGHPYDQTRALNGLVHALTLSGDGDGAKSASEQAIGLVDSLSSQLEDPVLKTSFLNSELVQEIRMKLAGK